MLKLLEFGAEVLGWLRIVASPLVIGLGIGAFIYFPNPSMIKLIIGISIAAIGLVVGIIWATRVWKKHGTMRFVARVASSRDLDGSEKE